MQSGVEAVAFDLDGTLYPNYRLYIRLIPFILREWPLLRAFGKARAMLRAAPEGQPSPGKAAGRAADFYDRQALLIADILGAEPAGTKEKTERLIYRGWERHFKKIRLFPFVPETLTALRAAGLKLGMLSDFPPETKLENLGIAGLWDAVLCSERLGALKPDPRPFEALAAALRLPPERILYVGNSSRYDVMGAKRAGMQAALVRGLFSEAVGEGAAVPRTENAGEPDFAFHDYRQLRDYMLH